MKIVKNYCHLCGAKYVDGKEQPWECSSCGNLCYENSRPCAEAVIFNPAGQVLVSTRGIDPNKGKKDLPGGFIMLNETVEDGLSREILEELELERDDYSTPLFCCSWTADDYEFSNESVSTLTMDFAIIVNKKDIQAHDDVAGVEFYDLDEIDSLEFSYPLYPDIIRKAHKLLFG